MKNLRNFVFAVMVMVGISTIESTGIHFWIALAMVFVPLAVLGVEEWNKQAKIRKYEKVKANCENIDFLSDCVIFGESVMLK